jgi:mannose/fructose/N-acetylgalactosamine-specific phosphotransferase system component IID
MTSGTKTTEFWVTLVPIFGGIFESLSGDGANSFALIICGTVLASLYIISRTIVKYKSIK